ncbi:MAG: hypothetical protein ABEJ57_03235, partial [Halobacteriaceae archaeon]
MTRQTDEIRGVTLAVLVVLSVLAGTVAFGGSVGADATSVGLSDASVSAGTDVTVTTNDDDTTGQTNFTAVLDANGNGAWDTGEPKVSTSSYTDGGSGITVGALNTSGLAEGTYLVHVVEGVNVTDGTDVTGQDSASLVIDNTAPTIVKATYYEEGSNDFAIELAYSEDLDDANATSGPFEVYVDGTLVETLTSTDLTEDGGQMELQLEQAYSGDITVVTPDIEDTAGNVISGATVDVRETDATLEVGSSTNITAFKGSVVAVDFDDEGYTFDITTGGGYFFQGSTGPTSELYVFTTAGKTAGTYYIDQDRDQDDGAGDNTITVRALDLSVSAPSEVQTGSTFTATVTANAGD